MFRFNNFVMEEANAEGSGGAGGGSGAAQTNIAASSGGQASNGAGASAEGAGSVITAGGSAEQKSWLDSLPDDIKKDPSLAMFKEPAALAKSWISAQKMIGADKVVIPGDKASDEERAAFYNKLGRPDAPEKYELKPPDGYKLDDATAKTFKDFSFKNGFTPAQVNAVLEFDAQRVAAMAEQQEALAQQNIQNGLIEYQKALGGEQKFRETVDGARSAVNELLSPEEKSFLDKTKLGSNPTIIGIFAKLKGMMAEGKVRDGTGVSFGADPSAIQSEITEIENPKSPLWDNMHPQRQSYVDRRNKLYERLTAAQFGRTV